MKKGFRNLLFALVCLGMTINQMSQSTEAYVLQEEIDIDTVEIVSHQSVLEDGSSVLLEPEMQENGWTAVRVINPDGTVSLGNRGNYLAPCNGVYEFIFVYSKEGKIEEYKHLEIVLDSNRMNDGNQPSKANGWLFENKEISLFGAGQPSSGILYTKLYPYKVTVDGQNMGPGNAHYVAYMQDEDSWAVYCLEPEMTAGTNFSQYEHTMLSDSSDTVKGKGNIEVAQRDLALTWYYTNVMYKDSGLNLSGDEWVFVCQIMIWDKLGYSISNYDSKFQAAIDWVEDKIASHSSVLQADYDDQLLIWENDPWVSDVETVYGTGGTCDETGRCTGGYLSVDGEVNSTGKYVPFDWKTQVASFGDPKYVWGDDAVFTIEDQEDENGVTHKVLTGATGGTISIKHCDEDLKDLMKGLAEYSSNKINVSFDKDRDGNWIYSFKRSASLEGNEVYAMSLTDSVNIGSSIEYQAGPELQELMQFTLPLELVKMIKIQFSEEPGATPSDEDEKPKPEKKNLVAPMLIKQDLDGNDQDGTHFPIEGATFTFHAGETYELHYVWTKEVSVYRCTGSGDNEVCGWEDEEPTEGKDKETVWAKDDEVMDSQTTPANGKIDTTPIIQNYYDAFDALWAEIQDEYAEKSSNESIAGEREVTYTVELDPEYVETEGVGWAGGEFYAMEPHTSENTCNSQPSGGYTCSADYDGYLNLDKWEKIRFTISEDNSGADQLALIHYNARQKGRFTVHKVDGETSYLNHSNTHEPQGDGYFYGAVYVVTARSPIVLHDGTIAKSEFTGNDLVAGEVADVLVMTQTPDGSLNNISTATTQMLELGEYAIQEVRSSGVYQEELPLVFNDEDGLWHVDPAHADEVLAKLKDKESAYYQFDYEKATQLYNAGVIPTDSPDGGYWYLNYTNGLVNTTNPDFVGGQTVNVDIKYVGEDSAYNEVVPNDGVVNEGNDAVLTRNANGETETHTMPPINFSIARGHSYTLTKNSGLDYANSVQKGHLQFKKILTQTVDMGSNEDGNIDDNNNIAGEDIYFGIYLNSKNDQIADTTAEDGKLPDIYFAGTRMDGMKYVTDENGYFIYYVDPSGDDVIGEEEDGDAHEDYRLATAEEIANNQGLVMISADGTATGAGFRPAEEYYEEVRINDDAEGNYYHYEKRNTYVNPTADRQGLTDANLSDKSLYMVLKTDSKGNAGTNRPETIVWANYAALFNTGNANSYGDFDYGYEYANPYDKSHVEVLAYLQQTGLPLPYGTYTVVELSAPVGYERVSWEAEITKNLTTYDINEDSTVWELGIERSTTTDIVDHLSDTTEPSGWTSQQDRVGGIGTKDDETWVNKQFHIFSDYVSTSRYVGSNIEDKLNRQYLQILKKDSETGQLITESFAIFRIFQWNPNLNLEDTYKHILFNGIVNGEATVEAVYRYPSDTDDGCRGVGAEWNNGWCEYGIDDTYRDENGLDSVIGEWVAIDGITKWTTDNQGQIILEEPLPAGSYSLAEIIAPEGYNLHKEGILFDIAADDNLHDPNDQPMVEVPLKNADGSFVCAEDKPNCNDPQSPDYAIDENGDVILDHVETQWVDKYLTVVFEVENIPQKGVIGIEKRGTIFDGFEAYTDERTGMIGWKPVWKEDSLVPFNTVFEVYAAEDIVLNGDIKYTANELVDTITTDEDGHGLSKQLYLGKYYVIEKESPHGYLTNGERMDVELTYDMQLSLIFPEFLQLNNDRQRFEIEILKSDEDGRPLGNAVFGIFAAEELPSFNDDTIPDEDVDDEFTRDPEEEDGEWTKDGKKKVAPVHDQRVSEDEFASWYEYEVISHQNGDTTIYEGIKITGLKNSDIKALEVPAVVEMNDGKELFVIEIGESAFADMGLLTISLPETLLKVNGLAFANNLDLVWIRFYESFLDYEPYYETEEEIDVNEGEYVQPDPSEPIDPDFGVDPIDPPTDGTETGDGETEIPETPEDGADTGNEETDIPTDETGDTEESETPTVPEEGGAAINLLRFSAVTYLNETIDNNTEVSETPTVPEEGTGTKTPDGEQPTDPEENIDDGYLIMGDLRFDFDSSALNGCYNFRYFVASSANFDRFDGAYVDGSDEPEALEDGYFVYDITLDQIRLINEGEAAYAMSGFPLFEEYTVDELDPGFGVDPDQITEDGDKQTTIPADSLLEIVVTDSQGRAVTSFDYPEGKYYIREIDAPDGYYINYDVWEVELAHDGSEAPVLRVAANNGTPIVDEKIPEEPEELEEPWEPTPTIDSLIVRLNKEMEGNLEDAWRDVEFGIFAAEDIYVGRNNPRLVYEEDEMLTSGHIDRDGEFNVLLTEDEFRLADGCYYVMEIATNENYVLDDTKWYFDYDRSEDGRHAVVYINGGEPIVNELKKISIQLEKIDAIHPNLFLEGAKFVLMDDDGNTLHESHATDHQGRTYFDHLSEGVYYLKEIQAPSGYELDEVIRVLEITFEDNRWSVYIDNEKLGYNRTRQSYVYQWGNTQKKEILDDTPNTGVYFQTAGKYFTLFFLVSSFVLICYLKKQ